LLPADAPSGAGSAVAAQAPRDGIRWIESEREGIDSARLAGRAAIIDFTADWCLVCHDIDAAVFLDPRVVEATRDFITIRLDFTRVDDTVRELQQKYGVRGLPMVLFIDREGRVLHDLTVSGFLTADEFLQRMRKAAA
jgi:thiol:disulfide interchange protein DsbD